MKRVTWKHAVAGLALLAALALVAPVPAQAAVWGAGGQGDAWTDGWTWISSLWDRLAMMLGGGHSPMAPKAPLAPASASQRGPAVQKSTTGSSGATVSGDNGSMINPDGQPAPP
ncbi:MAG TPA: hypothetical protein VN970_04800, partial [Thermoanaerobaculia bacterium]|nr:hypothetical protein [Thermoanaerobaculia bacterium]